MTKVITRYFEEASQAKAVRDALIDDRVPGKNVLVYTDADDLVPELVSRDVERATAEAYAVRLQNGGAVVLVNAGYRPLGVARLTRETMEQEGAVTLDGMTEEVTVPDVPGQTPKILDDHPLFLTRRKKVSRSTYHMADWPIPLISRRKPVDEFAFPRHARMANWPFPLIARIQPRDEFAFPRHARMADVVLPLVIRRRPSNRYIFPRHARMANWPIPLINRRKPFDETLIPRHGRMANWPFPLLINGKTGSNALIPGAPRMADYPVPLLSRRKPLDAFAFPRHARMANYILPLISRRKPFTASVFDKHARMADVLLPLVLRPTRTSNADRRPPFSLSRLLGIPTVIRR